MPSTVLAQVHNLLSPCQRCVKVITLLLTALPFLLTVTAKCIPVCHKIITLFSISALSQMLPKLILSSAGSSASVNGSRLLMARALSSVTTGTPIASSPLVAESSQEFVVRESYKRTFSQRPHPREARPHPSFEHTNTEQWQVYDGLQQTPIGQP